jgi:hypothetical protein
VTNDEWLVGLGASMGRCSVAETGGPVNRYRRVRP